MYLLLFVGIVFLYFNKNIAKNIAKKIAYRLLQLYTFFDIYIINNIRRIRNKLNRGLYIDYVYYYENNTMKIINKKKMNNYINRIKEDSIMYIVYKLDNIKYIDIVNNNNKDTYTLTPIKDMYYKGLVSACSVTIKNDHKIIYDEIDITNLFIRLLHNSINRDISIKDIKPYIYRTLNIEDNYQLNLLIIDNNCNICQLNEDSVININSLEEHYELRFK